MVLSFQKQTPPSPEPDENPRPTRQKEDKGWFARLQQSGLQGQPVVSRGSVGHPVSCAPACKYVKRKGGCSDGQNCANCHQCFWFRKQNDDTMPVVANAAPVIKPTNESSGPDQLTFSAGSTGHPHTCAEPCKYVRRKGGCRDGETCRKCHWCQWSRKQMGKENKEAEEENGDFPVVGNAINSSAFPESSTKIAGPPPGLGSSAGSLVVNLESLLPRLPATPPMYSSSQIQMCANSLPLQTPVGQTLATYPPLALPVQQPQVQAEDFCPSVGSIGHPYSCADACKYHRKTKGCKDGALCVRCHLCQWIRRSNISLEKMQLQQLADQVMVNADSRLISLPFGTTL